MKIKPWFLIHKWSSLVCTGFILMLCLTGLPLIFHHEIDHWLAPELGSVASDTAPPALESIAEQADAQRPGETLLYMFFDDEEPLVMVATAPSLQSLPEEFHYQYFDLRSGRRLDMGQPDEGFMYVMLKLHVDLFAGLPGTLFLGLMGLLLVAAIVSGVVLYGPFMRKLDFGTVRTGRSRRVYWLDLHNVLGIVTTVWLTVVAVTGVINTLVVPIEMMWQSGQLAEMTAPYRDKPVPSRFAPVDDVASSVHRAAPDMAIRTIAFPGTPFASPHHFGVYLIGNTPITSRVLKPALVDAATGELADIREMPLYVKTLFVSQPLHFGDYGGLPLKILWALLDVITIVLLVSGLYLWFKRPRSTREAAQTAATEHSGFGEQGTS